MSLFKDQVAKLKLIYLLMFERWPNFIFKDLPSVLILIIVYHILNDSLCCSNKYN